MIQRNCLCEDFLLRIIIFDNCFLHSYAGKMNKTTIPPIDSIDRQWYLVDAENQTLGRLATEVASILRGKNKTYYTPHLDTGDFVVVINAEKIQVTGKKSEQKLYRRHSGRPGGMKVEKFNSLQARIPERIVETAIKGMLPHNSLGRQVFRKLKVYKGSEHPHAAQNPKALKLLSANLAK
tara:strand:+ start:3050 stop:3589 length:540 start_codon:yes stop_codon:yes gene_type:complete